MSQRDASTFRSIVAGCNGYDRGRGALSLAHAIASATGARLLLVGVHHHAPLPFPGTYASQRQVFEHALRTARDELAPEALIRIEADISPAHALRRVAAAEGADLVVVGSRHRRRLQRIVDSDHAMQVLHGAPCAVAVAPDPLAPRTELRRIGVGIDETLESEHALEMALELAERAGATLWLHAVADDTLPGWVSMTAMSMPGDAYQEILDRRLERARALLASRLDACRGIPADGTVVLGSPAGELVLAGEGLDLLVLGSRRWGQARRLALGSTSEQVIRHATCPVLVPPRLTATEHHDPEPAEHEVGAR